MESLSRNKLAKVEEEEPVLTLFDPFGFPVASFAKKVKTIKGGRKQRNNELCECGSGRKYKRCCGKK